MRLSRSVQVTGWMLEHFPDLLVDMGKLESRLHANADEMVIERPIYIGSLARSGSTVLLESIAQHPSVASFCYRDFPFVHMPLWWHRLSVGMFDPDAPPLERAHRDRIQVTPGSPEAFEEILWMHFFPSLHSCECSQHLGAEIRHPDFESFYPSVIRKLLLRQKASRYAAKGNYNISRIDYLSRLFPDAQFVIPVRDPLTQVASLLRQHRHFCQLESENPAILKYLQRAGHFEFGLDRRPVNTGHPEDSRLIRQYFEAGRSMEGYAEQWRVIYGHVSRIKDRDNVKLVHYESLCANADGVLTDLYQWLGLAASEVQHENWKRQFSLPEYDDKILTTDDEQVIRGITADVARSLGYVLSSP